MAQAERHWRGQAHPAVWNRRRSVGFGLYCLALGKDAGRAHRQDTSSLGQRKAARRAMDQSFSQPCLQPLYCLRYSRSRQAEIRGGGDEGTGFGNLGEDRPSFQVRQGHWCYPKIGNDEFPSFLFSRPLSITIYARDRGQRLAFPRRSNYDD
jgi:hypothetical protein